MARSVAALVGKLGRHSELGPQLVGTHVLLAEESRFGDPEPPLDPVLSDALAGLGVTGLWAHQATALDAARRGRDVLITTPTASGKSLIFQLPVLEEAMRGGPGRALFLYPLKALGHDQHKKFMRLAAAVGANATAAIFDGDTPREERQRIKSVPPRVLISNPDMLHAGILSRWSEWTPFLRELQWLVLDELHTYRGIFGSHFHHVLQRLERICRRLGAAPAIITSSATAANAGGFARLLAGRDFEWVARSGAPRPRRHLLLFQPSSSPYTTTLDLLTELLESGLKTIVFTKARRITELLYTWLRQQRPELAKRVKSYRSGFLPEERRRIERRLFDGELDAVISTSALEMGIDVGGLDACILVGFPGSIMATWQRSGRAGRGERESLTALVALPDALDQYLLGHADRFIGRPCEELVLDPLNEPVARAHLVCAAAEQPLSRESDGRYLASHRRVVEELLASGELAESEQGGELHARRSRPHGAVNLRGGGGATAILELGSGRLVGTVDGIRVLHECHPGAIYLHAGEQYLVRQLDLDQHQVFVEAVAVEYFTSPRTRKTTEILEVLEERRDGRLRAGLGRLRVTEWVVGYERKRISGRETIDVHELDLPPRLMETVGLWWWAPAAVQRSLEEVEEDFMGALHATEHAAISLMPVLAVCDRGDIGGISLPMHPQLGSGGVFIYDGHSGGVGIAARAFRDLPELLSRVIDLLVECDCEEGCPACIQSPKCGNGNRPLDKSGALRALRILTDRTQPSGPWVEAPEIDLGPAASSQTPAAAEVMEGATLLVRIQAGNEPGERVAVAVHHLETGVSEVLDPNDPRALTERVTAARRVVGVELETADLGTEPERPPLDLLAEIERALGQRLSFSHLAQHTLERRLAARGFELRRWLAAGQLERIESACLEDLDTLRALYLFGRLHGHVVYRDAEGRNLKLTVDW
jgi:DEAD/DEAH box helicase domain-containing protein